MNDEEKFIELGIPIGKKFELDELNGYYMIDIENRKAIDMCTWPPKYVSGLYESLLKGCYHVRHVFDEEV